MSVIIWSIVAYLTNRPKNQPIFWSIRAKQAIDQNSLVYFGQSRALPYETTAPRQNIALKRHPCDNVATVWRHCRMGVAWGYRDKSRFPSFAWHAETHLHSLNHLDPNLNRNRLSHRNQDKPIKGISEDVMKEASQRWRLRREPQWTFTWRLSLPMLAEWYCGHCRIWPV